MTPGERWLTVLNKGKPDRVPLYYRATVEMNRKLEEFLGCSGMDEVFRRLHIDEVYSVQPRYTGPPIPPEKDIYGTVFQDTDYGRGTYRDAVGFPLADFTSVEEIEEKYQWPSADWFDYSDLPQQLKGHEDSVIHTSGSECFDTYRWLRGNERGYMDLLEYPEIAHYGLKKIYDFRYEVTRRTLEQIPGKVTWIWVAEDVSSQRGLIISLEQIREFLLPHMKRMIDLAHEFGAFTFHHSDGACRENIPNMIDIGMDVLDPVQWRCEGMDRRELKEQFGKQIGFHGAMDNQYTMAFGSVEEVRREVRDNIEILGKDGGLFLGPCHNLQVVSPAENVVALYDTAYEIGWYT